MNRQNNLVSEKARAMSKPRTKSKTWTQALAAMATLGAIAAAVPAYASDPIPSSSVTISHGEMKSLQLGVGRSMIVDLPEDAQEIFVGDPKIANAIVRSARRLYVTTLASGQTTIFALASNGRKIAVLEISASDADVGELDRSAQERPSPTTTSTCAPSAIPLSSPAPSARRATRSRRSTSPTGFLSAAPAGGAAGAPGGAARPVVRPEARSSTR